MRICRRSDEVDARFRSELMRACLFVGHGERVEPSTIQNCRYPEGSLRIVNAKLLAMFLVCRFEKTHLPLETFLSEPELRKLVRQKFDNHSKTFGQMAERYIGWRRGL